MLEQRKIFEFVRAHNLAGRPDALILLTGSWHPCRHGCYTLLKPGSPNTCWKVVRYRSGCKGCILAQQRSNQVTRIHCQLVFLNVVIKLF